MIVTKKPTFSIKAAKDYVAALSKQHPFVPGKRIWLIDWWQKFYPLKDIFREPPFSGEPVDIHEAMGGDWVYLFYNSTSRLTKIGISEWVKGRKRAIQAQSGCKIELLIAVQTERGYDESAAFIENNLHWWFRDKRVMGEWFNLSIRDILEIKNLFYEVIEGWDLEDNLSELYCKGKLVFNK